MCIRDRYNLKLISSGVVWYYYADYGLGSYLTCPYYVKWGSINAIAYCVEPSKKGPGNGTYTIQKLADGKTLAKVCYYGTKAVSYTHLDVYKRQVMHLPVSDTEHFVLENVLLLPRIE